MNKVVVKIKAKWNGMPDLTWTFVLCVHFCWMKHFIPVSNQLVNQQYEQTHAHTHLEQQQQQ